MIGIDHPQTGHLALGLEGDVVLPQVVGVDDVDLPVPAQGGQGLYRSPVKGAGHGQRMDRQAAGLGPLGQGAGLVAGQLCLDPLPLHGLEEGADVLFRPPLPGVVEQV